LALQADGTIKVSGKTVADALQEYQLRESTGQSLIWIPSLIAAIESLVIFVLCIIAIKIFSEFIVLNSLKKPKKKIFFISALANIVIPFIAIFVSWIVMEGFGLIGVSGLSSIVILFVSAVIIATLIETVLLKLLSKNELTLKEAILVSAVGYIIIGLILVTILVSMLHNLGG
jgi:hypothetical protein